MATKKTTTKKSEATAERVRGVDMAKVNGPVLDVHIRQHGIECGDTLEAAVEAFVIWTEKNVATKDLADCDLCGGASDANLPACPFCGAAGVEGVVPATTPAAPTPPVVTPPEDETPAEPPPPAPEATVEGGKGKKVKRSKATAAKPAEAPPAAPEPAAAPTADIPDDDGTSDPAAIPAAPPVPPAKPSGIAPSTSSGFEPVLADGVVPQSADELDKAVAAVLACKGTALWDLGRSIVRTYENDLWKQRRDGKGSPTYSGFGAFCQAELGISPQHAYKVMDVALRYTREDAIRIGVAKLGVVMRLPAGSDDERRMLESASSTPLSELASKVRELAKGKVRETGRKHVDTPQRQGKPPEPVVPEGSVTVALALGTEKVPLFVKGKLGVSRARTLDDSPIGEELLLNGVVQRYKLTHDGDGNLLLIVERRHVDTKAEPKAPKPAKPAKPAKAPKPAKAAKGKSKK